MRFLSHDYGRPRQQEEHRLVKCSIIGSDKFSVCPLLLWLLILWVNLTAPRGVVGLSKADSSSRLVGIIQSVEDLNRTKGGEKRIFLFSLPACLLELGHLISTSPALGLNYTTSSPGSPDGRSGDFSAFIIVWANSSQQNSISLSLT